jgi:hypothetical protein
MEGVGAFAELEAKLQPVVYDLQQDTSIMMDSFGPISAETEEEKYIRLPQEHSVHFVSTEQEVQQMVSELGGSDFIGVDGEWRPTISKS